MRFSGLALAFLIASAIPVASAAQERGAATPDWSGPYAGIGLGTGSGDISFGGPISAKALDHGTAAGLFLGHLWQRGRLVLGGELALSALSGSFVHGFTCCEVDRALDVKGRLGYATGTVLAYGVLGLSRGSYDEGTGDWAPEGTVLGLGLDLRTRKGVNVGVEYLTRRLEGEAPTGSGQKVRIDLDTLSLRLGLRF